MSRRNGEEVVVRTDRDSAICAGGDVVGGGTAEEMSIRGGHEMKD